MSAPKQPRNLTNDSKQSKEDEEAKILRKEQSRRRYMDEQKRRVEEYKQRGQVVDPPSAAEGTDSDLRQMNVEEDPMRVRGSFYLA